MSEPLSDPPSRAGPHAFERWIVFGVCTSLFIMSMFYRMSSAVIAEDLSRDLHLSPRGLGLVGGVFFYAFALVQVPLGLLLDRAGAKWTMTALNLVGILGAVLFSAAEGVRGAVLGRALIGVGMASNLMGSLKLFTQWFDVRRFATLSGLLVSLGTLGALAATSPLALLAQALGWRNAFIGLAAVHAGLVVALVLLAREAPDGRTGDSLQAPSLRPNSHAHPLTVLIRNPSYWAISWSIFLR